MQPVRRLLRATWIPAVLAAVLLVAVFVVFPRFGEPVPERGLSRAELRWAASYAAWREDAGATLKAAHEARTSLDHLGPVLRRAARCGESLERTAGAPPARLRPVAQAAARACGAAAAAHASYRALGGVPNHETSGRLGGALVLLAQADWKLRKFLRAERELPRRGGVSSASRIEPTLGAAAQAGGRGFVEVRCWSRDEWPAVRSELRAVGDERLDAVARLANSHRSTAHLSPRVCAPLARLAYRGDAPLAGPARDELARALVVFLHAAEHAAGARDERDAVCASLGGVSLAARRLGATADAARALSRLGRRAARAAGLGRCP